MFIIQWDFHASAANIRRRRHYVSWSSVRCPSGRALSVNIYFVWLDMLVLSGKISFQWNLPQISVNGSCWKVFQGRSEVKGQGHMCTNVWIATVAEADVSSVWRRGSLDIFISVSSSSSFIDKSNCTRNGLSNFDEKVKCVIFRFYCVK